MYRFVLMFLLFSSVAMAQVPMGVPQRPWNTFQDPSLYQQHIMKDSTNQRICYTHSDGGTWDWDCFASTSMIATYPSVLAPSGTSSPLCNGEECPDGTGYLNTNCGLILWKFSGTWETCPSAAPQVGDTKWDTTDLCHKDYNGTSWSDCLTTEKSVTFNVAGQLLILGSSVQYTVTVSGARPTKGSCNVEAPSATFPLVGTSILCKVTANNTLTVEFQGPIAGLSISLPGGTYRAYVRVPR